MSSDDGMPSEEGLLKFRQELEQQMDELRQFLPELPPFIEEHLNNPEHIASLYLESLERRDEFKTKPKVATNIELPADLVEYFRNVAEYIDEEHDAATTIVDDALQFDCCVATGGLYDKENWRYYIRYFPEFDEHSTDIQWELDFDRYQIQEIADGVATSISGWRCEHPECRMRFTSPNGWCPDCDNAQGRDATIAAREADREYHEQFIDRDDSDWFDSEEFHVIVDGDLELMQGTWVLADAAGNETERTRVIFEKNRMYVKVRGEVAEKYRIELDEDTEPKELVRQTLHPKRRHDLVALPEDTYELDGDRLSISFGGDESCTQVLERSVGPKLGIFSY